MASRAQLQVEIVAAVDGLADGLAVSTRSVEAAAQEMQLAFNKTGKAATSASKEHVGFTGVLKDFKKEQIQTARTASFFANQLAEIIPGAQGAKGALRGLIGIGLEGFGIGLAIEAATFALGQFVAHVQETEKHALDLRNAYLDTAKSIDAAFRGLADSLAGPVTKTAELWRSEGEKLRGQLETIQRDINEKTRKAASPGFFASAFGLGEQILGIGQGGGAGFKSSDDKEINKLFERQSAMIQALEDRKGKMRELAASEEVKSARDVSIQILGIRASMATGEAQIRKQLHVELLGLDKQTDLSAASRAALRVTYTAQANQKIMALMLEKHKEDKEEFAKEEAADIARQARKAAAEAEKSKLLRDYRAQRIAEAVDDAARVQSELDTVRGRAESLGGGLAAAWASSLQDMITGTKSFADGVTSIFSAFVDQLISMIVGLAAKWLVFNSIAGILTGGASFGAIGLASLIPGFATGGNYSPGPMIVGERGPELMVPMSSGTIIPNGALGGVNITINAMDGASVQRVVESYDFRRAMSEARRNGRL